MRSGVKMAIALFVLTTVVTIGGVWQFKRWSHQAASDFKPSLAEPITMPAVPTCFPGRSTEISRIPSKGKYFPQDVPPFFVEWFSKHLRAMNEPSLLSSTDSLDEVYRFLWLRSFHPPVAVRVWRTGEEYFLNAIELNGAGGYEPGKELARKARPLTSEEWVTFMRPLEESCFWNLPRRDPDNRGNDGAEWIVEGLRQGRYQVTDVWSPSSGAYRDACIYLLKISGLGIDEKSKDLY